MGFVKNQYWNHLFIRLGPLKDLLKASESWALLLHPRPTASGVINNITPGDIYMKVVTS